MNKHFDFIFHSKQIFVTADNMGRPWFLAKDIARILGYSRTYDMLRMCNEHEIIRINGFSGQIVSNNFYNINFPIWSQIQINRQDSLSECRQISPISGLIERSPYVTLINEPGVYRIIFGSNHKEIATQFQNWVFNEVLPRIRATGGYLDEDIIDILKERPDLIDEYLNEQKVIMDMWNNIEEDNENWVHESTKYEHLFDDPYDKLKYGIE